jgi:hypothetical protein
LFSGEIEESWMGKPDPLVRKLKSVEGDRSDKAQREPERHARDHDDLAGGRAARKSPSPASGDVAPILEDILSGGRDLVVAPRRPLLLARNRNAFPTACDKPFILDPEKDGIKGAGALDRWRRSGRNREI